MEPVPWDVSARDPAPLFELFRGCHATELLVAATAHLGLFRELGDGALLPGELAAALGLARRPAAVLTTALRAMGTLAMRGDGRLEATELARAHLDPRSPHYVGDYFALASGSAGVRAMAERLKTDRPAGADGGGGGVGFIYREGMPSAMEGEEGARFFTMALAGRARNVAPALAAAVPMTGARMLVDVAGGTGVYTVALLRANPSLRAVVWDRPEVLRVASEFVRGSGLADRVELRPGDMFRDSFPEGADVVLLSNVLHDWAEEQCEEILRRCAEGLPRGGRLVVHDVFLDDDHGGPLPVALYSAALFSVTEGRAYSVAEYRGMLGRTGFAATEVVPTRVHCGALLAVRR